MKKIIDLIIIWLVVIASLMLNAGIAYIGWNMLSGFLGIGYSISFMGWIMVLLFFRMVFGGTQSSKTYTVKEMLGPEFITIVLTRAFNKIAYLLIMWSILIVWSIWMMV